MKSRLSVVLCLILTVITSGVYAQNDMQVYNDISQMVRNNWSDDYIGYIKFTIGDNMMEVDGNKKNLDENDSSVIATIIDGKSMLPLRAIAEEVGAKIDFDPLDKSIDIELDDVKMSMAIGKKIMQVADEVKELDVPPVIENGKTYLPLRTVAETLGMELEWNSDTKQVVLTNDLQMKRILVKARDFDFSKYSPSDYIKVGEDLHILQFDTIGKTKNVYKELKNSNLVESVDLDKLVTISDVGQVQANAHKTWGAEKMHVDEFVQYLNVNNKNDEVVVAIIDSGIHLDHSIFNGIIKPEGYNFWGSNSSLNDESEVSHGTHVSGIIADLTKGTNVKILPLKVTGKEGKTSVVMLAMAIDYARKQNADVINMSMTYSGTNKTFIDAVNSAIGENIPVIMAAGNEDKNIDSLVKSLPQVIYVGAVDSYNQRASFSNFGKELDIVAPGVGIVSTIRYDYGILTGTSMAAPHISAVAALYKVNNKNLTSSQVEGLIRENVEDLGDKGKDKYYGDGMPNMLKFLEKNNMQFCKKCGKLLDNEWQDDGKGNHCKKCVCNYVLESEKHSDADMNMYCDVCLVKITTCFECGSKLIDEWKSDETIHYKECTSGHKNYSKNHLEPDLDGKCPVCKYQVVYESSGEDDNRIVDVSGEGVVSKAVQYVIKEKIMSEVEDGQFDPDGKVDREKFAIVIANMAKKDEFNIPKNVGEYEDCGALNALGKEAIGNYGRYIVEEKNFEPTKNLIKQEALSSFSKIYKIDMEELKEKAKTNIKDNTELIEILAVMKEYDNDELNKDLTREELAMMIYIVHRLDLGAENEIEDNDKENSGLKCHMCKADTYYKNDETMHVLICKKNKNHIIVEDHDIVDMKCTKCKHTDSKRYVSKFVDYTDESHWAWRNVCNLTDQGIVIGDVNGKGQSVLFPDEYITAEAFIALTSRILGYDGVDELKGKNLYMPISSDWSEGEWRHLVDYLGGKSQSILSALLADNVVPKDDKEIATNYKNYITREKAAYLLGCLFDEKVYEEFAKAEQDVTKKYEDWNKVSNTYKMRLAILTYYDILRGNKEEGKLYVDPQKNITRVQAIALVDRYKSVKNLFDE